MGLKNEFETAVVNEPSVFEPLKFYCNFFMILDINLRILPTACLKTLGEVIIQTCNPILKPILICNAVILLFYFVSKMPHAHIQYTYNIPQSFKSIA